MKLTILVILFNRDNIINDTIISLLNQSKIDEYIEVVVFNNGPSKIIDFSDGTFERLEEKYKNVFFKENIQNNPLSYIYNDFLKSYKSEYYLLLDDDTKLPNDYIEKLFRLIHNDSPKVLIPAIISEYDNKLYYPFIDGKPVKPSTLILEKDLGGQDICTIGSGLTISNDLLITFDRVGINPFDERFALYGVDFSFFRNLENLKNNGYYISLYIVNTIFHDMSGVKENISRSRFVEREIDKILSIRHYSSRKLFSILKILKLLINYLLSRDINMFKRAVNVYITGLHPRCSKIRRKVF